LIGTRLITKHEVQRGALGKRLSVRHSHERLARYARDAVVIGGALTAAGLGAAPAAVRHPRLVTCTALRGDAHVGG